MRNSVFRKVLIMFMVFSVAMVTLTQTTYAADLLPDTIQDLLGLLGDRGEGTGEFITSRVQSALVIGLALLILVAVVYAGFAALKYIRSQGEAGAIEEAGKATKAIFYGIIVLLLSIIGIVLIFVFFGAELIDTSLYQTCIAAPNSQGCISCRDAQGVPDDYEELKFSGSPGAAPYAATALSPGLSTAAKRSTCGYCEWAYFQANRNDTTVDTYDTTPQNICQE